MALSYAAPFSMAWHTILHFPIQHGPIQHNHSSVREGSECHGPKCHITICFSWPWQRWRHNNNKPIIRFIFLMKISVPWSPPPPLYNAAINSLQIARSANRLNESNTSIATNTIKMPSKIANSTTTPNQKGKSPNLQSNNLRNRDWNYH